MAQERVAQERVTRERMAQERDDAGADGAAGVAVIGAVPGDWGSGATVPGFGPTLAVGGATVVVTVPRMSGAPEVTVPLGRSAAASAAASASPYVIGPFGRYSDP